MLSNFSVCSAVSLSILLAAACGGSGVPVPSQAKTPTPSAVTEDAPQELPENEPLSKSSAKASKSSPAIDTKPKPEPLESNAKARQSNPEGKKRLKKPSESTSTSLVDTKKNNSETAQASAPETDLDDLETVTAAEVIKRRPISLDRIYFSKNDFSFPIPSDRLDALANVLRDNPDDKLALVAHVDPGETDPDILRKRRAFQVRAYLVAMGIDSKRVVFRAQGHRSPSKLDAVSSNAKRRCVELLLLQPPDQTPITSP